MKLHIGRGLGAAALLGLAAGLLFAGCSGSGATSAGGAEKYPQAPAPAASEAAGIPAPQAPLPQGPLNDDSGRLIARTASVTIVVDDVKAATQSLENLATTLKGWVTTESMTLPQDDPTRRANASIVISVPSDSFKNALDQIDGIGKVTDRSIQAEDVTEQVVDIDSRISTMRASIARLQELMAKTGSVSDIAAVERELTQREADLESLLAQQKSLQQRVATSTIAINVITPAAAQEQQPPKPGFVSALKAGWDAMTTAARYLVIVVGALLPWVALAAIITVPILLVRKRHLATGAGHPASPSGHPAEGRTSPAKPVQFVQVLPPGAVPGAPMPQPFGHPAEGRTSQPGPVIVQPSGHPAEGRTSPAPAGPPVEGTASAPAAPVIQPTAPGHPAEGRTSPAPAGPPVEGTAPAPAAPPAKPDPKKK